MPALCVPGQQRPEDITEAASGHGAVAETACAPDHQPEMPRPLGKATAGSWLRSTRDNDNRATRLEVNQELRKGETHISAAFKIELSESAVSAISLTL